MTRRFNLLLLFVALAAAVGGAATALYLKPDAPRIALTKDPESAGVKGLLWPNPKVVKPFQLTDHDGRPFDLERLKGHWSFLFFGFTHCPDVCPMALETMKQVALRLEASDAAAGTQYVFVSVDPARDTPEQLKGYVQYFDPDFIGATGEHDELRRMTRQLGIIYDINEPDAAGDYQVDHSAAILLTDPRGRMVGVFSVPHQVTDIADRFQAMRDFIDEHS